MAVLSDTFSCPAITDVCATPSLVCLPHEGDAARMFCDADGGSANAPGAVLSADCDRYREIVIGVADVVTDYYYDVGGSALVAVVRELASVGTRSCLGGPPTFVRPSCPIAVRLCG